MSLWDGTRAGTRSCVRPCVGVFTLSNMNISETSGLIAIKFYLKHNWGEGKAALGFGPDRIRTLGSMATDSYHRGKRRLHFFSAVFDRIRFILACKDDIRENLAQFDIWPDSNTYYGVRLAALERWKKSSYTYNGENGVSTFSRLFLIGSFSYLQVTMLG